MLTCCDRDVTAVSLASARALLDRRGAGSDYIIIPNALSPPKSTLTEGRAKSAPEIVAKERLDVSAQPSGALSDVMVHPPSVLPGSPVNRGLTSRRRPQLSPA
ncbi:hypothetical protein SCAR479_00573 [Seiridium cardinale]|uniref:Uncharacterized protein n=1 Tax=Seiridium cardinale TaxID=138064 RepID=A0ABR2Y9W0_9PEZI